MYVTVLVNCLAFALFCVQHTRFDATQRHRQPIFGSLFLACVVKFGYQNVFVAFDGCCRTPDR